ncbi:MAG: hypothetical protein MJZ13_08880 [Bacteroidales bacterium]|nr:hypothetical protein [Bacteroidales bacterium]
MKKVFTIFAALISALSSFAQTYQLVGGCTNNWNTSDAVQFEDIDGVLTAVVPNFYGEFKIIQDRGWANQWATNRTTNAKLTIGTPYTLSGKEGSSEPANMSCDFGSPFVTYKDAVFTLQISGSDMILTFVSGTKVIGAGEWYLAGEYNGWGLNESSRFSAVSDIANTYTISLPQISGNFKVVYGIWDVQFGSAKDANETWSINTKTNIVSPCDDLLASGDATYTDVTVTIVVDYDNYTINLLVANGTYTPISHITTTDNNVTKYIKDGKLFINKNGVIYNAAGQKVK